MSFPAVPRARSVSTPPRPTSVGPKWLSAILPTPPDPDKGEAAPIGKRPKRQFAAFDFGFVRLTSDDTPEPKPERCYEELEEEPEIPVPCVKLKDGRELRPLLKHRKRSASHHTPGSGKWNTNPSPPLSISSLPSLHSSSSSNSISSEGSETQPHAHPHVHFSDCLENVCVFDESAPAHDADPTHSPLEPPRPRSPPKSSPRIRTRQLRLPGTVIASPSHRAALGFDSGETSPVSPTTPGRDMHLTLACDSTLPSSASAPTHGMLTTLHVGLSPAKDALVGLVRVRNIAFEKHVQVVYTADGWQTRREAYGRWTDAYSLGVDDIPQRPEGYDDFEFSLPLNDLGISGSVGSAVRSRFLRFAIKYQVPGQGEWWDNREGHNWTARFRAVASDI